MRSEDTEALFRGDDCDPALVQGLEERLVNLWPAVTTLMLDGWAVRMANGYSARANSASALVTGASLASVTLRTIEHLFREEGLTPCVRVTPVAAPATKALLLSDGYRIKDESWIMHAASLANALPEINPSIQIERSPSEDWLRGVSALQEASKNNPHHLEAIVGQIRFPAGFATVFQAGTPVGFGMVAIDRSVAELGSIILAPASRGCGLGRELVQAMLTFAAENGAGSAFLQVTRDNDVARRLYSSLGFRDICGYSTLVLEH